MDQAKWSVPRARGLSKGAMMLTKPRFKLHGVWIQNVSLDMWVLDPRSSADSSSVLECACRSIQRAIEECLKRGIKPPTQLIVWVAWCAQKVSCWTNPQKVSCWTNLNEPPGGSAIKRTFFPSLHGSSAWLFCMKQ